MMQTMRRHLRLEPLEDRSLPSATVDPPGSPTGTNPNRSWSDTSTSSSTSPGASSTPDNGGSNPYSQGGQTSGAASGNSEPPTGTTSGSNSDGYPTSTGNAKPPAAGHGTDPASDGESPDEYKSMAYAGQRDMAYYPPAPVSIPPAPAEPQQPVTVNNPSVPRIVAREDRSSPQIAPQVGPEPTAIVPPPPAESPAPAPGPMPDPLPDPPAADVDQPAQPEIPETAEPEQVPAIEPLNLVGDVASRIDVTKLEHAAADLLYRLDHGLDDVINSESLLVRLGYWVGSAAVVGMAVELSRHGLRARRPNLDVQQRSPVPVKKS